MRRQRSSPVPSPFPGMDPYLEHPDIWPDVHHGLIEVIRESLAPRIRPRYRVSIEKRTYVEESEGLSFVGRPELVVSDGGSHREQEAPCEGLAKRPVTVEVPIPDVARESFLTIRESTTGEVVTVLELLSPSNKRQGEGRRVYEEKRRSILSSSTHLIEVDLLRGGAPLPLARAPLRSAYSILVSRAQARPRASLYPFGVREPIPPVPVPLREEDGEPELDLQVLLEGLYDRAEYDLAVDYSRPPEPPLADKDASWAERVVREHRPRE